jgi:hypothetical protein
MKRLITPAFILAVALLVLAELVARTFFARDFSGRFEYGFDSEAGFAERADGTVELFRAGGRRFRPQTFSRKRPDGIFRIFVLGDSVPRGPSSRGAYAWCLGQDLEGLGVRTQSLNLAVAGFGVRRCQIVLRKILTYDPSLIILHVDNNEYSDDREYRRSQEFKSWHPRHWPMKVYIFRRLYELNLEKLFWMLVPEPIRARFAVSDADAQIAASLDANKIKEWQARIKATTAESVALARRHQVPVLLLTQCRLDPDFPGGLNDNGLDAMAESLTGPGVYHLSMRETLLGAGDFRAYFRDLSGHLKENGHRLLAQAILEILRRQYASLGLAALKEPEPPGAARPASTMTAGKPSPGVAGSPPETQSGEVGLRSFASPAQAPGADTHE